MFKVGDRVEVINSVESRLIGKVGSVTRGDTYAGYSRCWVFFDDLKLRAYHNSAHDGRRMRETLLKLHIEFTGVNKLAHDWCRSILDR